ncbi:GerAB/ArcD/ProY family transporter [Gracilibacillus dipsosauri]|uniref:Spore gernimation protein n=1 Tax=Gracilibacillus dipsosauri TaxID=178340 RepID=A0A317KUE4_9BACI|nr:GerAB/ArcD/ProY family transporter [Gracilibacillus dipsosauri]PWU66956.1 spore gernimation protein [Gracilibacillus dipsosauri]
MDINVKVKSNLRIQAFYLFFLISFIQIGVGIMGVPRFIFKESQQDAWISVILASCFIVMVISAMLFILKQYENADILGIQTDLFGKWLGKLLGTIYIIHFILAFLSVIITYIEVLKIFIAPNLNNFVVALLLLSLVVYSVRGGLQAIVGVFFLFFFLSIWLLGLLVEPIRFMHFNHFQPMFQASFTELWKGAKATSYTFMGFEILFFVYPFIQNKQKVRFPTYLAIIWSSMIVLILTVISIGYFSRDQLLKLEWTVLDMFKIQNLTFIERFDYIVIAEWMMVVVPNMILLMWAITYGIKRLYQVKQKTTLYILAIVILIASTFIDDYFLIRKIIDSVAEFGFWIVYVYPLLLLPMVLIKKRWKRKSGGRDLSH